MQLLSKKIFFIVVLFQFSLLNLHSSFAQNHWIKTMGSSAADEGTDISMDANGNTYTTGYFSGTAQFTTGIYLTAAGVTDIFLTKINNQGIIQWAVKAGGVGPDRGLSIKTDALGNSFITGYFYGTATFGSTTISAVGNSDIFIAEYDANGVLQWVTSAGGNGGDIGNGINLDKWGNVLVTGQFEALAQFGSLSLISMTDPNTSLPSIDIWTAKYDGAGNILWVEQGAAPYTDRGLDIAADNSGNIFVTGQFSDTIIFDNTHVNSGLNVVFVIKYDSNGTEQWFRRISATQSIVYGIAVDSLANVFLTGDFQGSMQFWNEQTLDFTLTNTYFNRIFIAKYNSNGNFQWATADGSDSEISSRNIALDDSANAYIIGNFRCKFSGYANNYGQGTFNSVGYSDVFAAKYNSNGVWQWARNFGGHKNDYGYGITVNSLSQVHLTGSYSDSIVFPRPNNLQNLDNDTLKISPAFTDTYCGDSLYGQYYAKPSAGNSDIFIVNTIDLKREPMDYYKRDTGVSCNRDYVGVCIGSDPNYGDCISDIACASDSIIICDFTWLFAATNTAATYCYIPSSFTTGPIPLFSYQWASGETEQYIFVNTDGNYSVTLSTLDGCFVSADTINVIVHPIPPTPTISDSKGIRVDATTPYTIIVCAPDSVILTGGNVGTNDYYWTDLFGNVIDTALSITIKSGGTFLFHVIDSFGCTSYMAVEVIVDVLEPLILKLRFDIPDTMCYFKKVAVVHIYDSIPDTICIQHDFISYTITPTISHEAIDPKCNTSHFLYPPQTGTYIVDAILIRDNSCGSDTFYFTDTFSIVVIQLPVINITMDEADGFLCPGDITVLRAVGDTTGIIGYQWFGIGILTDPSQPNITINQAGTFTLTETNFFGCQSTGAISVWVKPSPIVSMNPVDGLICPNDSVILTTNLIGTYQWYGPSGQLDTNASQVVKSAGFYFCVVNDTSGCLLQSNTVEVNEYGTPFLSAFPDTAICLGGNDSVMLKVFSNDNSIIDWQPPLSGNDTIKYVGSPGTYTCLITSCGVTTTATLNIVSGIKPSTPAISSNSPLCEGDTLFLITDSVPNATYHWFGVNNFSDSLQNPIHPNSTLADVGIYSLAINVGGCISDTVNTFVSVQTTPQAIPNSNSPLCEGDTLFLNSALISNATYNWTGPNSFNSNQQNLFIVNVDSSNQGNYTLFLVSNNGCISSDSTIYVNVKGKPPTPTATSNSPLCEGDTLFLDSNEDFGVFCDWFGPNGFSSTFQNLERPNIILADSGLYFLAVSINNCTSDTANIFVSVNPIPPPVNLNNNSPLCDGDTLFLTSALISNGIYNWTGPGSFVSVLQNPVIINADSSASGIYSLLVNLNGCFGKNETTEVVVTSLMDFDLGKDTFLCLGEKLFLDAGQPGAAYFWQDNSTSSTFTIENGGIYFVKVSKANCEQSDTLEVKTNDCRIWIPNVFSPNDDGKNDHWTIVQSEMKQIKCKIYNRWGEKIYEWNEVNGYWDGTAQNNGKEVSEGVYFYLAEVTDYLNEVKTYTGWIELMR